MELYGDLPFVRVDWHSNSNLNPPPPILLFPFRAHSFIMQRYYFALSRRRDALNPARMLRSGGPNNNESGLGNATRARLICYTAVASMRIRIKRPIGRVHEYPAFPDIYVCFPLCPLFLSPANAYFNAVRL